MSSNFSRGEWDVTFYSDNTMHWRHRETDIVSGDTASFGFLVVTGDTPDYARALYDEYAPSLCLGH